MADPKREFDALSDPTNGPILTRAIIDTISEPLIILDGELRVIAASKSFYEKFKLNPEEIRDRFFYDLRDGQWDIPKLRELLEKVIPDHTSVSGFEIESEFPPLGKRIVKINAREVRYNNGKKKLLLSMFDITERRALIAEKERLIAQKDLLIKEMRHRIANSLQIIASILLLKAETVDSKESQTHLRDAHERIMSVAAVQEHLDVVGRGEEITVGDYLTALSKSLSRSMIGGRKPLSLEVEASPGGQTPDVTMCMGLIMTELVINALKHAFPDGREGKIIVGYNENNLGWTLSVSDNGVGETEERKMTSPRGLGTSIVDALATQLKATILTKSSPLGTKISIIHTGKEIL